MDLQEIITEKEKKLIRDFMDGRAIISRYSEETQQTRYMFKLGEMFYDYTSEGAYVDEMTQIGRYLTGPSKRIALSMVLDGNIREVDFPKYFEKWESGHILDLGKFGKICFHPDGKCYLYQNGFWSQMESHFSLTLMFMRFYSGVGENIPSGVIKSIREEDLAQIKEDEIE